MSHGENQRVENTFTRTVILEQQARVQDYFQLCYLYGHMFESEIIMHCCSQVLMTIAHERCKFGESELQYVYVKSLKNNTCASKPEKCTAVPKIKLSQRDARTCSLSLNMTPILRVLCISIATSEHHANQREYGDRSADQEEHTIPAESHGNDTFANSEHDGFRA